MANGIYIVIEQRNGTMQKVGLELLSEANKLAQDLSTEVCAILMGNNIADKAEKLYKYGADKVVVVDEPMLETYVTEPYAKALASVIKKYEPEIVLFGATSIGRDLAPRVASRIHTGLTADCTKLDIEQETKLLLMTRPAFGGNIMATIVCRDYRPQMATVRPGVMKMNEPDRSRKGVTERLRVEFSPQDMNVEILDILPKQRKGGDITEAKVLISGGRGVGGPAGYEPLKQLALELNGDISSSRVGVDSGWIEKDRQVGQTGKTVRPALYIACGISGAIQHMAGMEEADFILAINKDASAPMMQIADLAVEGDLKVIIPKLTAAIKEHREASRIEG